jgi:hypothetical protein
LGGASATEPVLKENVIHDSATAPFTALMVIGTAAVAVSCTNPHGKCYPITK